MSRASHIPKEPEHTSMIVFTDKELRFLVAAVKLAEQIVKRDHAIMEFKGETVSRDEGGSFKVTLSKLKGAQHELS